MKRLILSLVALVALTSTVQLRAANVIERRKTASFERVRLTGAVTVKYTQADTVSVWVEAPEDMLKQILTRVEGDCLVVGLKTVGRLFVFSGTKGDDITVHVTSPDLIGVEVKGSGDFKCKRHLDTDTLTLTLRGSGDIEFADIICDHVKTSLVGSGDVELQQVVAQRSDIELVGSGDITINQQQVRLTNIELKGSGDLKLRLTRCGVVNSRLAGSGDITLRGDADTLNSRTIGSGDIHTSGLTVRKK